MGGGAELIASGFGRYIDCWTRYLIANYSPDGTPVSTEAAPLFDAAFIATHDPELAKLAAIEEVSAWLEDLDRAVGCGDDFE